jgi:hypothetical protein
MRAIRRLSEAEQNRRYNLLRSDEPVILARREVPKTCNALSFRPKPRVFSDCGDEDAVLADIKIPDDLLPYCEKKGWLASRQAWSGRVVVVRHPSVEEGADVQVTPSNKCPKCVLEELRTELKHIRADAAAAQDAVPVQEPSSHTRPQIKRRRKSA